jgi:hypothetical protein
MARDRGLFELLARSIDELVDTSIPHRVVVPRHDLPVFQRFISNRREILAQEDVLPFHTLKIPALPNAAARLSQTLRRPVYLDRRLRMIRGWVLQQALKIEMSRLAEEDLVLHVDSDVFFIRRLDLHDLLREGRLPFFRATGVTSNPAHSGWIRAAEQMLGLPEILEYKPHYIENCVPWQPDALRTMTARLEEVHSRAWHDVLLEQMSFSEYYVYGLFLDRIRGTEGFYTERTDFCHSFWPEQEKAEVNFSELFADFQAHHIAMAVQSTHPLTLAQRYAIYARGRELSTKAGRRLT